MLFLHNRRLGRGRRAGDIDHIAIAPTGVWVIDAKHYANTKVRVRRSGGLLTETREQLIVAGRDRTKLVDSSIKQREAVGAALVAAGEEEVPVASLLCFVNADLPLLGTMHVKGVGIRGPRATGKQLRQPGPLGGVRRAELYRLLRLALPPA